MCIRDRPYIVLRDPRVAKDAGVTSFNGWPNVSIGVTPGNTNITDPDPFGNITEHPNELIHICGQWYHDKPPNQSTDKLSTIINGTRYYQTDNVRPGLVANKNEHFISLGNLRASNNGSHGCGGIQIYSCRVWLIQLGEHTARWLYGMGPNFSFVDYHNTIVDNGDLASNKNEPGELT